MRIDSGDGASGNVAGDVAAGSHRAQAALLKGIEHFRQSLDRDPMQLNVLPDGEVCHAPAILLRQPRNGSQLARVEQAIRDSYSEHETGQRLALAALAGNYARAVSLGVDAPPAKICAQPFGRNRLESLAGKAAYFVEGLPGILLPLQPFDALCFRFFDWICHKK